MSQEQKIKEIAKMIYDWLHENQVTHRIGFEKSKNRKTYLDLAERIIALEENDTAALDKISTEN